MGKEGVKETKTYLRSIGLPIAALFLWLSFKYVLSVPFAFQKELINICRFFTIERPQADPLSPAKFSSQCLKSEYEGLVGKRLGYFPANAGVHMIGQKLERLPAGTYIEINSGKIVSRVYCVTNGLEK